VFLLTGKLGVRQDGGDVVPYPELTHEFPAVILVNPSAGGGRAGVVLPRVQALFAAQEFPAEFVVTKSAEDLEESAREAIARGRRILLAMGGDGTLQHLVNAAVGADVMLGVLPAGGGNDFAAGLGLPKGLLLAAQAILRGAPRWVDLARARTADGRERLYVGGGGLGLDAEAVRYASEEFRKLPGRLRYVAAALSALRNFSPVGLSADFGDSAQPPVNMNVLLAAALNTPTYGAGLKFAPDARVDDGLLDIALLEDLKVHEVLALVPRLLVNGELRTARITRRRAKRVRFTTERPCIFHGDGEILGSTPVEIDVVPRAIRVLAPAPR
jgi:diacylglycerol kinase (ATP)